MSESTEMEKAPAPAANSPPSGSTPRPWTHGLLGCCAQPKWCLITCVAPCWTIGKNAEYFGEDCCLTALLYWFGAFGYGPVLRHKTRQAKGIEGSLTSDVLTSMCCPCCAMLQEHNELYGPSDEKTPIIARS